MVKIAEKDSQKVEEPEKSTQKNLPSINKIVSFLAFVAIIGAGSWFLYQNPQLLKVKDSAPNPDAQIAQLHERLNAMHNKLSVLEADNAGKISGRELAILNERIDTHTRLNQEILDSKAGNNTIIGLINRIDMLEMRVNNLGKVSSNGALVLTAAMLVKDTASKGVSFEYEAEVLRQLASGTNMQESAETIFSYSSSGLLDKQQLIAEFNRIYEKRFAAKSTQNVEDVDSADWKDKLNQGLSKLITVKYHNENGKIIEETIPEDEIYMLVNNGQLDQAVLKMLDNSAYQNEDFQKWQKQVNAQNEFNRALSRIQSLTLAVMKAENLKN